MKTIITESVDVAAQFIRQGEVVAFPTETVYGLGADCFNSDAVEKIFIAKGRPSDNPLIVHISDLNQLKDVTEKITDSAKLLMESFFPGPLTVILPKNQKVGSKVTANLNTVGVRMPESDVALQFIEACGTPIAAPSANLSGKPSPTTWEAVSEDLHERISCILKGEPSRIGIESTVVDCTGEIPLVLRIGAISIEELNTVVPNVAIPHKGSKLYFRSPGTQYKHYAPEGKVRIWEKENAEFNSKTAFIGLSAPEHTESFSYLQLCDSVAEYTRGIYQFFRACDLLGIQTVYCEAVEEKGIGRALMDRIKRASEAG